MIGVGLLNPCQGAGTHEAGSELRDTNGQRGKWGHLQAYAASRRAVYGNTQEARQSAAEALKLDVGSQGVGVEAALAFAVAGDTARVVTLCQL